MTKTPIPGRPVRGSERGTPLMAAFDLLGRRWAMGVIWQLCLHGPATFRDLQARCEGVSPSVLNARLKELREAKLVERTGEGYAGTARAQELFAHLSPMRAWAHSWAGDLGIEDPPGEDDAPGGEG